MTRSHLTPVILALTVLGGAALATTATVTLADAQEAKTMQVDARGGMHGARGEHGHRGGPRGEMMRTMFDAVDADGDRAVTQEEIDAYRAARVGEADTSGDGALSIAEFETLYQQFTRGRMVDAFQALDADGDGQIAPEELDTRIARMVERLDRDGDGVLTLQRGRGGN